MERAVCAFFKDYYLEIADDSVAVGTLWYRCDSPLQNMP